MATFVRQPPPPTRPTTALTPPGAASAHNVRPCSTDPDRLTSTCALDSRQVRLLVSGSATRHKPAPAAVADRGRLGCAVHPRSGLLRATRALCGTAATVLCGCPDTDAPLLVGRTDLLWRRLAVCDSLAADDPAGYASPIQTAVRTSEHDKGSCGKSERAFPDIKIKD